MLDKSFELHHEDDDALDDTKIDEKNMSDDYDEKGHHVDPSELSSSSLIGSERGAGGERGLLRVLTRVRRSRRFLDQVLTPDSLKKHRRERKLSQHSQQVPHNFYFFLVLCLCVCYPTAAAPPKRTQVTTQNKFSKKKNKKKKELRCRCHNRAPVHRMRSGFCIKILLQLWAGDYDWGLCCVWPGLFFFYCFF